MPSTATSLSLARAPRRIVRLEVRTSSTPASNRQTAPLARPSRGGAVTRTMSTPSRNATNALDLARGWTRTEIVARGILDIIPYTQRLLALLRPPRWLTTAILDLRRPVPAAYERAEPG